MIVWFKGVVLGMIGSVSMAPAGAAPRQVPPPALPAAGGSDPKTTFALRAETIHQIFDAAAADGGSFVMLYNLGEQRFSRGYGHLDCARTKPMPANAVIDSGSLTKAFTYAAVYKLLEQGRLKLDDRLNAFFRNVPPDKASITIAQLLDHQAGFHDFIEPSGRVPARDPVVIVTDYLPVTKEQMLRAAFASDLRFAPGAKEEYSNLGYQVLAAIIERVSGTEYERYVRLNILLPAGMEHTGYRLPDFSGLQFAEQCKGEQPWGDPVTKGLWKNGVSWNLAGAGGMMTTVDDLRRWTEAITSGKLFRPDIQDRFRRSRLFMADYKMCQTEVSALAGSNGLTWAGFFHMPLRNETLILASTRSEKRPPQMKLMRVLCGK